MPASYGETVCHFDDVSSLGVPTVSVGITSMSTFHLFIIQPMRFDRELHYTPATRQPSSGETIIGIDDTRVHHFSRDWLQEQLFAWSPDEEVWGGIADESLRLDLKTQFVETREISTLKVFIDNLQEAVQQEKASQWIVSSQETKGDTAAASLSLAPTVALLHHLMWIYETFRDAPGISIVVR